MFLKRVKTPGIAHVSYVIGNKGEAAVIDPRRDVEEYITLARDQKLTIRYVIETHRQEDFVLGSAELARLTGAKIVNGRHELFADPVHYTPAGSAIVARTVAGAISRWRDDRALRR